MPFRKLSPIAQTGAPIVAWSTANYEPPSLRTIIEPSTLFQWVAP